MLCSARHRFAICARSQEFRECISTDAGSSKCHDLQEDYLECLHHKKEVRRRRPAFCCRCRCTGAGSSSHSWGGGCPRRARAHAHGRRLPRPLPGIPSASAHSRTLLCLARALAQTSRFNQLNAERIKKAAHGEPTKLVNEQIAAGEFKLPWTNAK